MDGEVLNQSLYQECLFCDGKYGGVYAVFMMLTWMADTSENKKLDIDFHNLPFLQNHY